MAENYRNIAEFVREHLRPLLPADYPLDALVGLVETSIGKMVPIMKDEDTRQDPLWVFAEAYNELILDKRGFKGELAVLGQALSTMVANLIEKMKEAESHKQAAEREMTRAGYIK